MTVAIFLCASVMSSLKLRPLNETKFHICSYCIYLFYIYEN